MAALALDTLRTKGHGRPTSWPARNRGASRAAQSGAPPRARRRPAHARVPARANYRVPGLHAVHWHAEQARAPRASPVVHSSLSLMFPRPERLDGSAKPPPRRAHAPRLAVRAQPDAHCSPCVRRSAPDGASGLGAPGGYAHSSHFRSPRSRPLLPPALEGTGKVGRRRGQDLGLGLPGGREARVWEGGTATAKSSCPQW